MLLSLRKTFRFSISLVALSVLLALGADRLRAQELDAQVEINLTGLSEQERQVWETFRDDIRTYLNGHSWTSNFTGERIRCTFQLNIISSNGNSYNGQLFVTSTRSLYKSDQLTTMARFFDDKFEFSYTRGQVLQHGAGFRPIESVLDFYVYIILGLDYDSYQMQSGTPFYQQAQQVAVQGTSAQARGWERSVSAIGTYSRVGYIEDVLNANNRAIRDLFWQYHYQALDLLGSKPQDARVELANVIDSLVSIKKGTSAYARSPFVRTFFEAKYPELTDLARLFPTNVNAYFQKLVFLDPLHQTFFEDARSKFR